MNEQIKYFSMFSGVGGFEYGIERTNYLRWIQQTNNQGERSSKNNQTQRGVCDSRKFSCVGFSEIDKYAIEVYQKHYPNHPNFGDCTKIDASKLPDFDFLCGGFPCQSFSIAGKRRGFEDTRGTMFFHIARILEVKRPTTVLLENVKGLLNHNKGETFKVIIQTLEELGYDVQWMVLNSKFFGVPQNRERVFIIGNLRGTSRPEVLPFRTDNRTTIENWESENTGTLCAQYGKNPTDGNYIKQLNNPTHSNNRIYGEEGVSPALNTAMGGNRQPKITTAIPVLTPDRPEKCVCNEGKVCNLCCEGCGNYKESCECIEATYRHSFEGFKGYRNLSPPIKSSEGSGNQIIVNKIRRLTPTECERLQGFPDGWTAGLSDTQRYKTMGNAVTTNVISAIVSKLQRNALGVR